MQRMPAGFRRPTGIGPHTALRGSRDGYDGGGPGGEARPGCRWITLASASAAALGWEYYYYHSREQVLCTLVGNRTLAASVTIMPLRAAPETRQRTQPFGMACHPTGPCSRPGARPLRVSAVREVPWREDEACTMVHTMVPPVYYVGTTTTGEE